jgi:hypothetical protein
VVRRTCPDTDFDDIYYYPKPNKGGQVNDWDMLPDDMKGLREAGHP